MTGVGRGREGVFDRGWEREFMTGVGRGIFLTGVGRGTL